MHLYPVWRNMLGRCENPLSEKYPLYGARGIKVCEEWHNPKSFIDWVLANGYERGLQIDRINNDGNYEPNNCRFATRKQNQRNKRNNHILTINGISKCIAEWADIIGVTGSSISQSARKYGDAYAAEKIKERMSR